jgi:hypothetical protein
LIGETPLKALPLAASGFLEFGFLRVGPVKPLGLRMQGEEDPD